MKAVSAALTLMLLELAFIGDAGAASQAPWALNCGPGSAECQALILEGASFAITAGHFPVTLVAYGDLGQPVADAEKLAAARLAWARQFLIAHEVSPAQIKTINHGGDHVGRTWQQIEVYYQ